MGAFVFIVKLVVFMPVMLIKSLHTRHFLSVPHHESEIRSHPTVISYVNWWAARDYLADILSLGIFGFWSAVLLSFWINVAPDVQMNYGLDCLVYIFQWYLLEPFEKAFFLAFWSGA